MLKIILFVTFILYFSLLNMAQEVMPEAKKFSFMQKTLSSKQSDEMLFLPYGQFSLGFGEPRFASHFGELGVGLLIPTRTSQAGVMDFGPILIFPVKISIGMEMNYLWDSPHYIYAPKITLETWFALLGVRVSSILYTKHKIHDLRLQPEAGITFFGILGIYAGWCLPVGSSERIPEVSDFKVSFYIF